VWTRLIYSPWHEWPYNQIWSISKLNSFILRDMNDRTTKYGALVISIRLLSMTWTTVQPNMETKWKSLVIVRNTKDLIKKRRIVSKLCPLTFVTWKSIPAKYGNGRDFFVDVRICDEHTRLPLVWGSSQLYTLVSK